MVGMKGRWYGWRKECEVVWMEDGMSGGMDGWEVNYGNEWWDGKRDRK